MVLKTCGMAMAKLVHGKYAKKAGRSAAVAVSHAGLSSAKGSFRFPSNSAVKVVASGKAKAAGAGLKKLQQTYKSAGHQIMGTTGDGVVIVRPSGKPDSFTLTELQEAFSPKNTKLNARLKGSSF